MNTPAVSFYTQEGDQVKIKPWPTESILAWIIGAYSALVWVALIVSIVGLIYILIFGLITLIVHAILVSHVRGNGVLITPQQFPELNQRIESIAKKLGFQKNPEAYVVQAGGILNAMATKFLRREMIIIYSELLEACEGQPAARDMIIGHELGHLKAGHLKWHWFFLPGLMMPLLGQALSRAREYTCDRYGFAVSGDHQGALNGLSILAAGKSYGPKVNHAEMSKQVSLLDTGLMTLAEWFSTHPPLVKRIYALDETLKPAAAASSRGALRAILIIGAIFILPIIIVIFAGSTNLFMSLKNKASNNTQEGAKQELLKLSSMMEKIKEEGATLPTTQMMIEAEWTLRNPGVEFPKDPRTNNPFQIELYQEEEPHILYIYSDGPDTLAGTEDDVVWSLVIGQAAENPKDS